MVRALFALAVTASACAPVTRETAVPEAPVPVSETERDRAELDRASVPENGATPRRRPRIGRLGPPFAALGPARNTIARSHERDGAIVSQR